MPLVVVVVVVVVVVEVVVVVVVVVCEIYAGIESKTANGRRRRKR